MNRVHSFMRSCHLLPPRVTPVRASRTSFSGSSLFTASLICLPRPLRSNGKARLWLHENSNDFAALSCRSDDEAESARLSARDSDLGPPAPNGVFGGGGGGGGGGAAGRSAESSFSASAALILPSSSIVSTCLICSSIIDSMA